jgi:hypothetical protein
MGVVDDDFSMLGYGMRFIFKDECQWIVEDGLSFCKANVVFLRLEAAFDVSYSNFISTS